MKPISLSRRLFGPLGAVLAMVAALGCNDPLRLGIARFPNAVDTLTLFALRGTDIPSPSAFDIVGNRTARAERGDPFDFAFDIDDDGRASLLTATVLGIATEAGILLTDSAFVQVTTAPLEGYVSDSVRILRVGDVFVARSRSSANDCGLLGALPRYGKFRVLAVDQTNRTLALEQVVNVNCGFRNLQPGLPES